MTPDPKTSPHPFRRVLRVVIAIYAGLVLLAAFDGPMPVKIVHRDSLEYIGLASNLSVHGVFGFEAGAPSARRELLYPLFLAAFMELGLVTPFEVAPTNFWPVLAVQAGLYVGALAMLAERARRLVPDAVARTTLVLGAAYFPVAKYAFQLLSESLTIALVSGLFFVLSRREAATERRRLFAGALLLGMLGLLKSVALPAAPLLAGFLARARRATVPLAVAFAVLALSLPGLWLVRNHARFERFVLTTDGSSALYRGNMKVGYQPQSFTDPMIPEEVRRERSRLGVAADSYLVKLTRQRLREAPGEYALGLVYKLFNLWVGDPRSSDGPVMFVLRCFMALLVLSQLPLLTRSREPDARLVLYLVLYVSALYTLIYTTPRYFVPATFLLLPLAANALYRSYSFALKRVAHLT